VAQFRKEYKLLQPGEPRSTTWNYEHKSLDQPIRGIIRASAGEGSVKEIVLSIDNYTELTIPFELMPGESVVLDGSQQAILYDSVGKYKKTATLSAKIPMITKGNHQIKMDALMESARVPVIEFYLKAVSSEEKVSSMLK
jgi:hypothetical protein